MDDGYEMPNMADPKAQSGPKDDSHTLPSSGYVRFHILTLVLTVIMIAIGAATGTGILVYFVTAGERECKLVLPDGYKIPSDVVANQQAGVTTNAQVPTNAATMQSKSTNEPVPTDATTMQSKGPGTVYIRWGRTVCPNNTNTLYDGYAAGSHFQHSGGMTDTLCLPKQPQWAMYYDGLQSEGIIYGSEYESQSSDGIPQLEKKFGKAIYNHDVPCVVCEAVGRLIKMVVPARTQCFDGWTLEYTGFMMAERHTHAGRSQMKCVDGNPEVLDGQSVNSNGHLFYLMEAAGQLPDPPYIKERELTCAVCTK